MPHVVTDLCFDCKHTDCVAVCPVDCFHEDDRSLWIDPVECIDCAACVPECPEEAIFDVVSLPEKHHDCILKNAERSKALPIIIETAEPLLAKSSCS